MSLAVFLCLKTTPQEGSSCGFFIWIIYQKKEVKNMTLNILFLTITIKRRKQSREEANHQEIVNQLYEKHKDRQISNIL
jgi:uncharacterized protein (TIGR02413 family)